MALYRVALESVTFLKVALVTTAAMLAICLLALVATNTAEATSLPHNGKIAFTRNGAIYTVEPDGSNLSQLTDGTPPGDRPVWSPDGTKIAFSQIREDITFESSAVSGISVMSADGSNLRDLHTSKASGSLAPAWLPDGTKLAFSGREAPPPYSNDIYMMDPDGTNLINLTKTWSYSELVPAFSPNASQMCFSRGRGIYVMNVDGSDPTLLAEGQEGDDTPEGCNWSPDGTKLAFTANSEVADADGYLYSEVYVINADGSARTALTSKSAADRSAADTEPDWSPDGRRITFASSRDGDSDIYTMDADGSDVAQVTNSPGDDYSPDWQPLPRPTSPQSRSVTVHPPDTGGPSLLLVASALLFSVGFLLSAVVKRGM